MFKKINICYKNFDSLPAPEVFVFYDVVWKVNEIDKELKEKWHPLRKNIIYLNHNQTEKVEISHQNKYVIFDYVQDEKKYTYKIDYSKGNNHLRLYQEKDGKFAPIMFDNVKKMERFWQIFEMQVNRAKDSLKADKEIQKKLSSLENEIKVS